MSNSLTVGDGTTSFIVSSPSNGLFTLTPPPYRCAKHGEVQGIGPVILTDAKGNEISRHCMKCYQEMIAANCCEVAK